MDSWLELWKRFPALQPRIRRSWNLVRAKLHELGNVFWKRGLRVDRGLESYSLAGQVDSEGARPLGAALGSSGCSAAP